MPQYLLLRDNKQSGPYSFEELTAKGLKAYDLIWIEGKSAAWRYPSEIEELKPFSPVVEEQPYDRFYKRNDTSARKSETTTARPQETTPAKKPAEIKNIPNRRVVVILPGGQRWEKQQEPVKFHETVENKIQRPERPVQKPVGLEEEFAEPLPVSNMPATTIRNYRNKKKSGKAAKFISATFALLTIGVLLGWAYNYTTTHNQGQSLPVTPAQTVKVDEKPAAIYNNESIQAVNSEIPEEEPLLPEDPGQFTDSSSLAPAISAIPAMNTISKKQAKTKAASPEVSEKTEPEVELPASKPEATVHVPAENNDEAEKKLVKKNISELIKVSKNDFKVGAFGGISNLEVKVTNNSGYPVDLVVVEVKYLLANKKEFKTENIYFKNLSPGATVVKEAPKSPRGITVSSKVALLTSKALGMYQASL